MKKTVAIIISALLVAVSLVSGVFALYTTTLDDVNDGSVVAKNFVLTAETTNEFGENVKIAPTEEHSAVFTVSNYDATYTTETAMNVTVNVTFTSDIAPLTISLVDADSNDVLVAATTSATSAYDFSFTAGTQQTKSFKVIVAWPSTDNDIDYMTESASYTISVTGVQA